MGQLMWVRMLLGNSTKDANGGVGIAEPGMGILEANIRGCDWKCKMRYNGKDYMLVLSIYLKGLC
jgi:hypothetical protein